MKSFVFTIVLLCLSLSFALAQQDAFLGIHSNSVSTKKAKKLNFEQPYGAYVTNVIGNTAAEKAGFQVFDYIYQVDDYVLDDHYDLHDILDNYQAGDRATVYYLRQGEKLSEEVVFGKKSEAKYRERERDEDPFLGIQQNHNKPSDVKGVSVDIVDNSTAKAMGLKDDDIITRINGYSMIDWHDVGAAIDDLEVGDPISVTYRRGNKTTTVTNPIQSLAATKGESNHGSSNYSYSYDSGRSNYETKQADEPAESIAKADMEDMEVEMEDMPEEDAERMKEELGVDMPIVQNLRIEQLNIFPNPSSGRFNLTFDLPNEGETNIRIFSGSGRLVYDYALGNFSGAFQDQLNLGDQPAGTYFVMIQQGTFSVSKKVIVSRN